MKRRLERVEIWLYRRILRISWTKDVSNERVLRKIEKKRTTYYNQKKIVEHFGIHYR